MNVELLRKVQQAIRENPDHFDMRDYIIPDYMSCSFNSQFKGLTTEGCGTTACIGGWAMYLGGAAPLVTYGSFFPRASELLGLSIEQAKRLFYDQAWPDSFRCDGVSRDVENACARIDHFIATNGEE